MLQHIMAGSACAMESVVLSPLPEIPSRASQSDACGAGVLLVGAGLDSKLHLFTSPLAPLLLAPPQPSTCGSRGESDGDCFSYQQTLFGAEDWVSFGLR